MNTSLPRHKHDTSEQIWYSLKGNAILLLEDEKKMEFNKGEVVRFIDGDIHGLRNESNEEFVYISVTAPLLTLNIPIKMKNKV